MGPQDIHDLGADVDDWIERVHRALKDDGKLLPAQGAQLALRERQHVYRLRVWRRPIVCSSPLPRCPGKIQHLTAGDLCWRLEQTRDGIPQRRFAAAALTRQPQELPAL